MVQQQSTDRVGGKEVDGGACQAGDDDWLHEGEFEAVRDPLPDSLPLPTSGQRCDKEDGGQEASGEEAVGWEELEGFRDYREKLYYYEDNSGLELTVPVSSRNVIEVSDSSKTDEDKLAENISNKVLARMGLEPNKSFTFLIS